MSYMESGTPPQRPNDPQTPYTPYTPPPTSPGPTTGGVDNYGWQATTDAPPPPQPPQPPQQPYAPYQSYGQPYGQPQPVGSYYPGPMAPATNGFAIASLICSILGFLGFLGLGALLGVIFGHMALREINNSNGAMQGKGMAQAGLILGYIHLGLIALLVVIIIIFVILGAGAAILAPQQ